MYSNEWRSFLFLFPSLVPGVATPSLVVSRRTRPHAPEQSRGDVARGRLYSIWGIRIRLKRGEKGTHRFFAHSTRVVRRSLRLLVKLVTTLGGSGAAQMSSMV